MSTIPFRKTAVCVVDESMGWLVQVSLMLFAFTGSARLLKGVNANSMRLACTSQQMDSSTAKLELPMERKSTVASMYIFLPANQWEPLEF